MKLEKTGELADFILDGDKKDENWQGLNHMLQNLVNVEKAVFTVNQKWTKPILSNSVETGLSTHKTKITRDMYLISLFEDKKGLNFHSTAPLESVLLMFSKGVFHPANLTGATLNIIQK